MRRKQTGFWLFILPALFAFVPSKIVTSRLPFSFCTPLASIKLMEGFPTKSATNRLLGLLYTVNGASYCCNTPLLIRQIFVASVIASIWSCVTYTKVLPVSTCRRCNSYLISRRSFASRLDSGSSMNNTWGSGASVLAMATLCCCPPDSSAG